MPHPPLRVVVADANLVPHRSLLEATVPAGTEVVWLDRFDEADVIDALPGTDVLVGARFTTAMTSVADSLRLVHVGGAGYDGVDADALPAGTQVANTFHHESSIAEYVAAMTVVLRRQLLEQDRALRAGEWASSVYEPDRTQPRSLQGATVGIVGFGHIGQRAWEVFKALGARGVALTGRGGGPAAEEVGLEWTRGPEGLADLLAASDVVVLCLPLSDATRHLVGADQLAAMRTGAILVNVSRGPLVDPDALLRALRERRIGGAVLDTWYSYPTSGSTARPAEQPFEELDNVLMTPHVSGVTSQTFAGRAEDIGHNIARLQQGEALVNVVITR
jgi:phosphoglycerate dehydrogenase-like enzyme